MRADIGGGFETTHELHVIKYNKAMKRPDAAKWVTTVGEEHDQMTTNRVFKAVPVEDVPKEAKVLTLTWAMKKKTNGDYRARVNAQGYE